VRLAIAIIFLVLIGSTSLAVSKRAGTAKLRQTNPVLFWTVFVAAMSTVAACMYFLPLISN
jgi:hypothetical protein